MATDVSQIERTTSKIESIKKKTANDENAMNQGAKDQKIKMKFHATAEISRHVDLMKHERFFSFSKKCQCWYN